MLPISPRSRPAGCPPGVSDAGGFQPGNALLGPAKQTKTDDPGDDQAQTGETGEGSVLAEEQNSEDSGPNRSNACPDGVGGPERNSLERLGKKVETRHHGGQRQRTRPEPRESVALFQSDGP